jgi:seryl-tRNA synthetase
MPLPHAASCSRRARLPNSLNPFKHASPNNRTYSRPSFAPKPVLDLKHIRQNPGLYEQNCVDRNYAAFSNNGWRILELHQHLLAEQSKAVEFRRRGNALSKLLGGGAQDAHSKDEARKEAKGLKESLAAIARLEKETQGEMERLAMELPNLSSLQTPVGGEAKTIGYVNGEAKPEEKTGGGKSHVEIGKELDLLDFQASATTSGWGWYFLKNEGALLEQALIQYALSVAMARGWKVMTPPSLVYSHIASACGFMPRDQNGETQVYNIAQPETDGDDKPSLVLAGTAEIPFAGSKANTTLAESDLPLKVIGPSRCYRAEAGARGVDTKGLYRVHEFTKVEMFAWTKPPPTAESSDRFGTEEDDEAAYAPSQSEATFQEMLSIQTEILTALGLHARILEMPSTDLGASATRKIDIEVFFPSRTGIDEGYGEVTSASICTDYQSRRLGTRFKGNGEQSLRWPHTVNGTAMAVPRILAAVLENGWVEGEKAVVVPEVLRKWMPGGMEKITCARA